MKGRRRSSTKVFVTACGLGLVALCSIVEAGEYYSWVDPSGTMVMTDDPGRIPPASERSSVAVHRYQDRPASPSTSSPVTRAVPAPIPAEPERKPSENLPASQAPATEESQAGTFADTDLPKVLLDPPEGPTRTQYAWVPLVAPIYVGSGSVSGFWSHRSVASPVEAFTQFLRQHRLSAPDGQTVSAGSLWLHGGGGAGSQASRPPVLNSGNPVYDQVMRERQALIERNFSRFRPPSQAPGSSPRPGHGHTRSGR